MIVVGRGRQDRPRKDSGPGVDQGVARAHHSVYLNGPADEIGCSSRDRSILGILFTNNEGHRHLQLTQSFP